MTEPTDDEIATLYTEQTGFALDDSPAALLDFARAVLAKWGTPPAVAGEPVAYRHMHDDGWEYYDAPTGSDCAGCVPLYTTPQPTQAQAEAITPPPIECDTEELKRAYAFGWWSALEKQRETAQAGAVPLTDEQIRAMCKEPWIFDTAKQWVRLIEAAHGIGIKGGQHVGNVD